MHGTSDRIFPYVRSDGVYNTSVSRRDWNLKAFASWTATIDYTTCTVPVPVGARYPELAAGGPDQTALIIMCHLVLPLDNIMEEAGGSKLIPHYVAGDSL